MNAYDIAQTKKLIPLSEEEFELINEIGIVTGSYVFGGYTEHISDIDVIIPVKKKKEISYSKLHTENKIYAYGNQYAGDFFSCYVKTNDNELLNLLFMSNELSFKKWKKATKIMIKMKKIKKLAKQFEDKKKRVQMFEFIKEYI